jgi:predicted DNA-binding protein with PD1-like motif
LTGSQTAFQDGRLGRIALIRLRPNQDLVAGVEAACAEAGLTHAVVRSGVGSLVDAVLEHGGGRVAVSGPGVEILTLLGEVRPDEQGSPRADLRGTISDAGARVYGGVFVRHENPICITLELVLQEWQPA